MRRKSKFFKRFLLSFLTVLVLPVIVFTMLFMSNFRQTYEAKVMEQIQSDLERAGEELDRHLKNLHSIVVYNSQMPHMKPYAVAHDVTASKVISTLGAEAAVNTFVASIYYYSPATPHRIYTESGTYTLDYFTRLITSLPNEEALRQLWQTVPDGGWLLYQSPSGQRLQYVITTDSGEMWFFNISQQELTSILHQESVNTVLRSPEGTVLHACHTIGGDNEANYTIEAVSANGRFSLVRSSTEETFFAEVLAWQNRFLLMVGLVLVAGFVLITLLTFYNEKPFHQIRTFLSNKLQHIPEGIYGADLVQFSFENMEERMDLLERQQRRERLLLQLVLSDGHNIDHIKNLLKAEKMFTDAIYFRVLAVAAHSEEAGSRAERYLEMAAGEGFEFRSLATSAENKYLFAVGLTAEAESKLEQCLQKAGRIILEDLDDQLRFYVGGRCDALEELHYSYREAILCSRKESSEQICFFREKRVLHNEFHYPAHQVELLYNALVDTDMERAVMLTDMLLEFLEQHEESKYLSASIYYDLVNTYYKAQSKLETGEEVAELDVQFADVKDGVTTYEKIEHIRRLLKGFWDRVEESEKVRRSDFLPEVIAFIDENITAYELSVGMVADHFHISISNLSHQFNAKMDRTVSNYIAEKKFDYARKLLLETDDSIGTIAKKLGYSQATSFIRKFKQIYGITPSEYKIQNSQAYTSAEDAPPR